jgi:hypothetical protein
MVPTDAVRTMLPPMRPTLSPLFSAPESQAKIRKTTAILQKNITILFIQSPLININAGNRRKSSEIPELKIMPIGHLIKPVVHRQKFPRSTATH